MVHTYINAMPHQVMGYFADRSKAMVVAAEMLDNTYTVDTALLQIPIPIPTELAARVGMVHYISILLLDYGHN